MDRREFLAGTSAAFFATLVAGSLGARDAETVRLVTWRHVHSLNKSGPAPLPEITAAVDVIVPPDPEVADDFKGSDYHADWVVAASLGDAGQLAAVMMLNKYARQIAGRGFINCSADEQIEAIRQWVREREELAPLLKEMLTGLLTLGVIGTYENNTQAEQLTLFESMGWYDPKDPSGTFRVPNEGYVDSFQFPAILKKGLKK